MLRVTRQPGLGGEFGGEWIYVYVWLSLCCSPETITTLLISYTPIQNVLVLKNNKNENLKKIILSSI